MKLTVSRVVVFAPNWLGDAVMALPAIADIRRALPAACADHRRAAEHRAALQPGARHGRRCVRGRRRGRSCALRRPRRFSCRIRFRRRSQRGGPASPSGGAIARTGARPAHARDRAADWRPSGGVPTSASCASLGSRTDRVGRTSRCWTTCAGWARDELTWRRLGWPRAIAGPRARRGILAARSVGRQHPLRGWRARSPRTACEPSWSAVERTFRLRREIEAALEPLRGLPLLNLMGTDLPTLAGVLANCRALVSNDSGAMHLAVALGVRVTAVFGPTDERMTRPAGDAHIGVDQPGVVPALLDARVPDRSPLYARRSAWTASRRGPADAVMSPAPSGSRRPAVFLDRDGTLIEDVGYLGRVEQVQLYPWTIDGGPAVESGGPAGGGDDEPVRRGARNPDRGRDCRGAPASVVGARGGRCAN